MKKHTLIITMLALLFLNATTALFATSFKGEQDITISTEVNEDLYLAGGNILIDAPIRGDLICAGGDVTIQDTITEDVMLVGGTLKVMGYIGDDLRIAGGTITITNTINGDLIIAGGDVTVGKDAVINGNLQMVGGKLTMNGTVRGIANLRGGEIYWNGIAEKELTAKGGNLTFNGTVQGKSQLAAQNITLGSSAKFYDNVEYWNPEGELDFGNTLLSGATSSYNESLKTSDNDFNWRHLGVGLVAFWIYRLLAAALIIVLLMWMFHRFFSRISPETTNNFANHLGYGFLYIIGLPVLIIVAFITVIGIPTGMILMTTYGLTIALGHVLASLLIAYGLNTYYEKNWNRRNLFLVALGSYLGLKIVGAIPFLGFVVSIIVVTTAIGTILYIWWKNRPRDEEPIVE
jgi:hypothetical protein